MIETKKSFCRFCHAFCGVEVDVVEAIVERTEDLTPGVVALAFGWGDPSDDRDVREKGSNVQRLIPDDYRYDRVTGLALQAAIPVNVHTRTI